MKKDLKTLNKSVALAIAAAMTVTSAPSSLLAADFGDAGDFVSQDGIAENGTPDGVSGEITEENGSEEAPGELAEGFGDQDAVVTEGFGDSTAVEIAGSGSTDPITETDAEVPGKIGHVAFSEENKDELTWYADQKADRYQIRVTDGEYSYYYYNQDDPEAGYQSTTALIFNLPGAFAYQVPVKVNADGTVTSKQDEKGNDIQGLEDGKTYQVSVRAVNSAADGTVAYGEWSDAISYTYAAVKADPKKVTIQVDEDEDLVINGTQIGSVRYEAEIKDAEGNEYFAYSYGNTKEKEYASCYVRYTSLSGINAYVLKQDETTGTYEVAVDKDGKSIRAFLPGKTYTIRVRAYTGSGENKKAGEWSDSISYTMKEQKREVPEKTGNFNYTGEYVNWNSISNVYVNGYEVEVDGKEADIFTTYGSSVYLGGSYGNVKFEQGKTYEIRVRGYNYDSENKKQTGEWSDVFSFTYGTVENTDLKKVSGVSASEYYEKVSWNRDENASWYEIKVTDDAGREYFNGVSTDEKDGKYLRVYGTSFDLDEVSLQTYTMVDGVLTPVIYPATGNWVRAFEAGKTYQISVRAGKTVDGKEVTGEWSNGVSYTVTAEDPGTNEVPAAVTGVVINDSGKDDDSYSDPYTFLQWNAIDNVNYYEILVKDASGREYVGNATQKKDGTVEKSYYTVGSTNFPRISLRALDGLRTYNTDAGMAFDYVRDASGDPITAMTPGETYTFQVRAVRIYKEKDADGKEVRKELKGEWSAPSAAYKVSEVQPITDLQYAYADGNYYYFTYSADVNLDRVWYQIATSSDFSTATMVRDWSRYYNYDSVSATTAKLRIAKRDSVLKAGTTYYVRAVNSEESPTKEEEAKLNGTVASFTTDAVKAAKAITGLELYKEYDNSFQFQFDPVLEAGDHFELQYTDKAQASEEDWVTLDNDNDDYDDDDYDDEDADALTLSKSLLKEGNTYVRVVAYVLDENGERKYGTPSNIVTVTLSKVTSSISDLKFVEKNVNGYVFSYTGTTRPGEEVEFWYSKSPEFTSDHQVTDYVYGSNNKVTLGFDSLTPGETYYMRARVSNDDASARAQRYSAYTNVVTFKAGMPRINVESNVITSNSVTLMMDVANGDENWLTGYEIQRKDGKKYVAVAKTTDQIYKNGKLKSDTAYTYRVRPYYYDQETKKTTYGDWAYNTVTTWGGALKLKAAPKSATSVKLAWTKIKGAQGYEIYRCAGNSATDTVSAGTVNGFSKYVLIKTVGAKTSSYLNKSLQTGTDYTYVVRAYRTVGKNKYYISESQYASLKFEMVQTGRIAYANGKVKVSWQPVYSGKGYLVEKKNEKTGAWESYKTLKTSASSYTFPASENGDDYRIRAYSGQEYTNAIIVNVDPVVATPGGVKAVANQADGSITITWNPVAGADYYRVYRTTSSWSRYNKDSNSYTYAGNRVNVPNYVADSATISGYKKAEIKETTTVTDRALKYTYNGVTSTVYSGPEAGVRYYYYVVAYKNGKAYEYEDSAENVYVSGSSKSANAMLTAASVAKTAKVSVKAKKGSITVNWRKVTGAVGYQVYRSTKKGSGYKLVKTITKGSTVKYVDKSAKKAGTKYYYKIRTIGVNEAGVSIYSGYSTPKYAKAK